MNRRNGFSIAGNVLLGMLLACWLARAYFLHSPQQVHVNDEGYSYAGRLIEFRNLLGNGYVSPQWCMHFRGGLGSPYFSYYQPGFFYAASLVPWWVSPLRALGVTVVGFGLLGYLATAGLVGRWFGRTSGLLAGSGLLLSVYAGNEISFRGDLSEFAAMMTLPVVLWALAGWLEHERLRYAACLALTSGALIVLHPAVALIGFVLFAVALAAFLLAARRLRPVLGAATALGFGAALAAFYWLPVFFEWDLVAPDKAFTDFYHYSKHFVGPLAILDPWHRHMTLPLTLGPVLVGLVFFNTFAMLLRREKPTPWRRGLLLFCLVAGVLLTLLMTRCSAPLWARLSLLQRLQFPWRIMSLVTVLAAVAAGCMVPWRRERLRAAVVGMLVAAMGVFAYGPTSYRLDPDTSAPANVAELMRRNFVPDLRDEWLPRGAARKVPQAERTRPSAGPGCRIEGFRPTQGRLSCRVTTDRPSHVVLPHYYFPVGWQAEVDGASVPLVRGPHGLMQIELPPKTAGRLQVCFSHTPMRRRGLWISATALLLGGLLCAICRRRRR
ncbi:MAG: hypothetical protein JXB62_17770 [Pirellulales bacterium]|nr:hypothetical protein [Pirellulales bacterium]